MPLTDDKILELNQNLSELKVNTNTIVLKMEQIYDSIEKLEKTVESVSAAVSSQEKRVTVLEQSVPKHLLEDLAILKNSQASYNKLLWIIGGGVIAALIQSFFKVMP